MNWLNGVTVLDLSHVLAGPYCTMLMGDLGAEVIKLERPGSGDDTRAWGPPFAGGESAYYLSVNRNKRSLALDLKSEDGKQIVRALAAKSNVLIENFSPGTMERLGLGHEALRAEFPHLIYCSLSGYGQTGPDRALPGFDVVVQARGGLMSLCGEKNGPPAIVGISVVDIFAGLHALNAILAALFHQKATGQGARLDMALLDSLVNILTHQATSYLMTGKVPGRLGNAHHNIVPYQTFKTRDGFLNIAAGNDKLFGSMCKVLKQDALPADARFATNSKRVENRAALLAILEPLVAARDTQELFKELSTAHVPAGPVQDMAQVFADPQVQAREMTCEFSHPTAGTVKVPAFPGLLDGHKPAVRRPPPLLGEHSVELLKEVLGYSPDQIQALLELKVVVQKP